MSQNNYSTWLAALLKEIKHDRVMIFIHGYANPWTKVIDPSDANYGLTAMLGHFWSYGGLKIPLIGPIVVFDWPSTGTYHEAQKKGADTATKSFKSPYSKVDLKQIIDDIAKAKPRARINIVCHSMGNYVFAKGAGSLTPHSVSLAFINAAAIDAQSFDPDSRSPTLADGIQQCVGNALILNTSNDDALPEVSDKPDTGGDPWVELGIWNVAPAPQYYSCTGCFDLSDVVNKANQDGAEKVHTAYYYIPLVLDFINFYLNFDFAEADKSAIANSAQVKRINLPVPA